MPYDKQSLSAVKMYQETGEGEGGGGPEIPISIKKVDDKTLAIVPTGHIYNNAYYCVDGLDKITDKFGNPVYEFSYQNAYFMTDLNGDPNNPPQYTIENDTLEQNQTIKIRYNFNSPELLNKAQEIKLYRQVINEDECPQGSDECYILGSTASISQSQIEIELPDWPGYNMNFWIDIPATVDDHNNFIPESYPVAKILPKEGTSSPALVGSIPAENATVSDASQITLEFNNEIAGNLSYINVFSGSVAFRSKGTNPNLEIITSGKTITLKLHGTVSKGKVYVYFYGLRDIFDNYLTTGKNSFWFTKN